MNDIIRERYERTHIDLTHLRTLRDLGSNPESTVQIVSRRVMEALMDATAEIETLEELRRIERELWIDWHRRTMNVVRPAIGDLPRAAHLELAAIRREIGAHVKRTGRGGRGRG